MRSQSENALSLADSKTVLFYYGDFCRPRLCSRRQKFEQLMTKNCYQN